MATKVYETLELELQDGTLIEVRPLPIKRLRKATEAMNEFSKSVVAKEFDHLTESEVNTLFIDVLVSVVEITLERKYKELIADKEEFEDILDTPTMYKIVEVATGWKFNQDADDLGKGLAALGTS